MYALVDAPSPEGQPEDLVPGRLPAGEPLGGRAAGARGADRRAAQRRDGARAGHGRDRGLRLAEGHAGLQAERERGRARAASPGRRSCACRAARRARRSASKSGEAPARGNIYDAGGRLLNSDPTGASIAGTAGEKPTGLERIYDDRLGGRRTVTLRFGDRVIKKIPGQRGKSIHTTIRLGLQKQANAALGKALGGVAVIKPQRRLGARARRPGGLGAPATRFLVQDRHRRVGAAEQGRHAVERLSGAHVRDALGRQAAQRVRRDLRRDADQLVRALLQQRLRPGRREGRAPSACWPRRRSSASTSSRTSRRPRSAPSRSR